MRQLKITIDGKAYNVTVEDVTQGNVETTIKTPVAAAPVTPQETTQAPKVSASGEKVTSPMPGNMWKVMVKEGQVVKKGELLVILEAMKMENEIMSPCDGTVLQLGVVEGQSVDTDQLIAVIG